MTKEIKLTKGQVAIVDDWRYDELNAHKWCAHWSLGMKSYYAERHSKSIFGKSTIISMHAVVAGTPKGYHTDHINGDTLYNLESNLRVCTSSQNQWNSKKRSDNTSGFKGVVVHGKKWQAQIQLNKKMIHLGTYPTREDAARTYDEAAKRLHGEFATLNFPDE